MPLIRVTHPAAALSPEARDKLAESLTAILLDIEGGHDTAGGRTLAYVVFSPVAQADWYVGGSTGVEHQRGADRIIVDVTVPEAATTQPAKGEIHRRVNEALAQALGWSADEYNVNAWVIVNDIPEGHWGAAGETFGLARIAAYAGGPDALPDPERFAFVRDYFTAKGTVYGQAGFPAETSGLMQPS